MYICNVTHFWPLFIKTRNFGGSRNMNLSRLLRCVMLSCVLNWSVL